MKWLELIPEWLRKFIGYGVSSGLALVMLVLAFGAVPVLRDWLRNYLNVPTRTENREDYEQAAMKAAEFVVDQAMRNEHLRQDTLYNLVERGLIAPGMERLESVEQRVGGLETWSVRVDQKLGIQSGLLIDQTGKLGEVKDMLSTEAAQKEELREILQQAMEKLNDPDPTEPSPRRVTKQKL